MIKYNVMIGCRKNTDNSDLDALVDSYDVRILNYESKGKYDFFTYIVSEDDIIAFLSELPYEYFVNYVFDDTIYQINITKARKNADIYKNRNYDKYPHYKVICTPLENEIFSLCKYIEKNFNL